MWCGADPGGVRKFGVARLASDGQYTATAVSSVDEATEFFGVIDHLGIDSPMWWCSAKGGGRFVDERLRARYRLAPGTVQSVNSLRGAAIVQGVLLAMRVRATNPTTAVTETHPKALLKALHLTSWSDVCLRFGLSGRDFYEEKDEHERDAVISAVAAREAALGRWNIDLAERRWPSELHPQALWYGKVNYWWPETI